MRSGVTRRARLLRGRIFVDALDELARGDRAVDEVPEGHRHVEVPALHQAGVVVTSVVLAHHTNEAEPSDEALAREVVREVGELVGDDVERGREKKQPPHVRAEPASDEPRRERDEHDDAEHADRGDEDELQLLARANGHVVILKDHVVLGRVAVVELVQRRRPMVEEGLVRAPLDPVRDHEDERHDEQLERLDAVEPTERNEQRDRADAGGAGEMEDGAVRVRNRVRELRAEDVSSTLRIPVGHRSSIYSAKTERKRSALEIRGIRALASASWLVSSLAGCAAGPSVVEPAATRATPVCATDAECPAASGACRRSACREGACVVTELPAGTPAPEGQIAGDCRRAICDAHGEATSQEDATDTSPQGSDPCVHPVCDAGVAARRPSRAGTDCGRGGACDGKGVCLVVRDIAAGRHHSCALLSDGSVQCWGANESGQLGDGTLDGRAHAAPVLGLTKAKAIAAGGGHSCALLEDGSVACWGTNERGQLGDGTHDPRPAPTTVRALGAAVELALGFDHTCARLSSGELACWGANGDGQLGVAGGDSASPSRVKGLASVAAVGAGGAHTCARLTGGEIACWGKNDHGQLGDGGKRGRARPTTIASLRASVLAVGKFHTCALRAEGEVACWGWNADGQLGDGTTADRARPVPVDGLPGALDVVAGNGHTCARVRDGRPRCWGWNADGQLGDGTRETSARPREVREVPSAARLALGSRHTCALAEDGGVTCWGKNDRGQLGDGSGRSPP